MVADAIGAPLDSVEMAGEVAAARRTVAIAAGTSRPARLRVSGSRLPACALGGRFLTFRANWYCTRDIDADWDLRETGWRVQVSGDAPLDIQISNPVPLEELGAVAPNKRANRAMNAVPFVCEAAPGMRTTVELPHVLRYLGA